MEVSVIGIVALSVVCFGFGVSFSLFLFRRHIQKMNSRISEAEKLAFENAGIGNDVEMLEELSKSVIFKIKEELEDSESLEELGRRLEDIQREIESFEIDEKTEDRFDEMRDILDKDFEGGG